MQIQLSIVHYNRSQLQNCQFANHTHKNLQKLTETIDLENKSSSKFYLVCRELQPESEIIRRVIRDSPDYVLFFTDILNLLFFP